MGRVVAIISISIAAQAAFTLLVRAFHALKNTWLPFGLSVAMIALFFAGCFLSTQLHTDHQLYGLALTLSLIGFLEAGVHLFLLNHQVKGLITKDLVLPQLKIMTAGLLMAVGLYIPFKLLDQLVFDTTRVIPLIALTGVTSLAGLTVYILLAMLLKIKEQRLIWQIVSRLNRKKLGKVEVKSGEPIVSSADMIDEV
jgi:putative peptidoglycan lipid II flippase